MREQSDRYRCAGGAMRWLRKLFDVRSEDAAVWSSDAPPADKAPCSRPPHTKPRVRIRPDGWIRHCPGPFPFAPKTVVEIIFADGLRMVGRDAEYASFWFTGWWLGEAESWRRNIRFYRIVCLPRGA